MDSSIEKNKVINYKNAKKSQIQTDRNKHGQGPTKIL